MDRKYIQSVKPLTDHVLQVDFISGSRLLLDMKPYLDKFRFRSLSDPQVWNSAVTNGIFVRFGDVEMSHNELFSMAEQEHHRKGGNGMSKKQMIRRRGLCGLLAMAMCIGVLPPTAGAAVTAENDWEIFDASDTYNLPGTQEQICRR